VGMWDYNVYNINGGASLLEELRRICTRIEKRINLNKRFIKCLIKFIV